MIWLKMSSKILYRSPVSPTLRTFASYGGLVDNNWKENPNGEIYRRWLRARGRSDVQRLVDDTLRPQVDAINDNWAIRKTGSPEGKGANAAASKKAAAHPEVNLPVIP
jgi:hypothetical protein